MLYLPIAVIWAGDSQFVSLAANHAWLRRERQRQQLQAVAGHGGGRLCYRRELAPVVLPREAMQLLRPRRRRHRSCGRQRCRGADRSEPQEERAAGHRA